MAKTIERRQKILQLIKEEGKVAVDELAVSFNISTVTIRNDLNALDKRGLLVRARGGALASNRLTQELSLNEKHTKYYSVKKSLGKFAASLINNNESVILDSGTTTQEIATNLHGKDSLIVMTNGLNIANELANHESINVMMTGGSLRQKSMSFYGKQAEENLRSLRFDKLFLGVDGADIRSGITTHFEPEARLNSVMCEVSNEIIAVTDSSKFNQYGFHIIRSFNQINRLITDSNIPKSHLETLRNQGVKVDIIEV